ncbi:MAG: 3-oxoacyl-[acyl-carrier-protein] reductase [Candidatus Krumholzibacteriia bacterium]
MDFAGKVGLVTGASRGIGREIALQLARRGADVALTSRKEPEVRGTAEEVTALGVKAIGYACDVASFEAVRDMAVRLVEEFGRIDFLVNNAGIVRDKLILRMSPDDWGDVLSVNLTGAYNTVKVFAPHFLKQKQGRIVNISSVIGLIGNAGQSSYAASKAGIVGFTRALAKEFAPRNITVNAVAPGYISTAMTEGLGEDLEGRMLELIPLKRFGSVEDVANIVIFLLSGMADYVTGQVINCDGGMVMG